MSNHTSFARPNTQTATSRRDLATLRFLGRGIAATTAVAVLGVGSMSAADASSAGVARGVQHVTSTSTSPLPAPTDLPRTGTQIVVSKGVVSR